MTAPPRPLPRRLRYAAETILVYVVYTLFRLLPLDAASGLGGWLGRHIGPHLGISRVARRNIAQAFPEKNADEQEKILTGMWDNLGRVTAEYPHLHRIWDRVTLDGGTYLKDVLQNKKPVIFFAGHLANWEICAIAAKKSGIDLHLVYRKPNNPGVDSLLRHARESGAAGHIEKGGSGAREILHILKNNGAVGILIDQKLNEGLPIPFFGRDAMTAPAIAHFAMRFDCTVYPAQVERLQGAHFKMTVFPPLTLPQTGDKELDTRMILTDINAQLEKWIRTRPDQWLWIHRRWPD